MLQQIEPLTWLVIGTAIVICAVVLFNKAVKLILKFAVIIVMALFVGYFLVQAGLIQLPN